MARETKASEASETSGEAVGEATLYERVAGRLSDQMASGTLRPGDRMPSVRRLHRQWGVSISTVMEAYRVLESRGVVEARPQSGFYVRSRAGRSLPEPSHACPKGRPCKVNMGSLMLRLTAVANEPAVVRLGAAVPAEELLPTAALDRLMRRLLRTHGGGRHGYDMPPGSVEYRRQVARRMMDAGCAVGPDDVLATTGAQYAVWLALRAVTEPGDTVAIETPTYFGLLQALESLHLKALEIPSHPREGVSLTHLADAMSSGKVKACALVTNFSNPLGVSIPESHKREVAKLAQRHGVPVVEDDVYGELQFEGPRPRTVKAFDRAGLVLYCGSFSKTLSPGMRAGWCAPGRFMERVAHHRVVTTHAPVTVAMEAVARFLAEGAFDRHLRRLRGQYAAQVALMQDAVARHFPKGTRMSQPAGGHVLWVQMPESVEAMGLHDRASALGISIAPGPMFSATGAYRNCIRLNCGLPWSGQIEEAVRTLGALAREPIEPAVRPVRRKALRPAEAV